PSRNRGRRDPLRDAAGRVFVQRTPMPITVINLDEFIPEERAVIYKGKEHILHITSTESYLKVLKTRKKLAHVKDDDELAQTEIAIELITLALPTIPKEDIVKLPLGAMMRLVDIVQREMDLADVPPADGKGEPTNGKVIEGEVVGVGESTLPSLSPG